MPSKVSIGKAVCLVSYGMYKFLMRFWLIKKIFEPESNKNQMRVQPFMVSMYVYPSGQS